MNSLMKLILMAIYNSTSKTKFSLSREQIIAIINQTENYTTWPAQNIDLHLEKMLEGGIIEFCPVDKDYFIPQNCKNVIEILTK